MMIFDIFCKNAKEKRDQQLRAPSSVGRYNSTRVDEEGRKCSVLAIKIKTHVPKWDGGGRARYVTPNLSYYWEVARE